MALQACCASFSITVSTHAEEVAVSSSSVCEERLTFITSMFNYKWEGVYVENVA
jgi:hypothetical protein